VDDERRAKLRPVARQRPCLLVEADDAKTLKAIYWAINGAGTLVSVDPQKVGTRECEAFRQRKGTDSTTASWLSGAIGCQKAIEYCLSLQEA
jgi:hypothetical protein